jgi:NAD(P)-dependent dehydrogenase (short-subunit alcohol dehydrogenase family)
MDRSDAKVALVTGGTSGIGMAIAVGLARSGATVVLLARDAARAQAATAEIVRQVPGAVVETLPGDLASQTSVRLAAGEFRARHPRLDILVCSAGVFHKTRTETEDGIESTFAVNYLSQFLLANLLEEALRRGTPSRVVFVASRTGNTKIDFDDLMVKARKFTILNSVAPTKLAEVLLAQELSERWAAHGIVVNAIHPGLVAHTGLLDEVGGMWRWMTNTFGGTPEKGADTAVWLATSPEAAGITGKLLAKRKPIRTPGQGSDPAARRRLWEESVRLSKLPSGTKTSG